MRDPAEGCCPTSVVYRRLASPTNLTPSFRLAAVLPWYHLGMANTPRNYWMVAVRPEYYDKCAEMGFNLLGMGRNQRKRVQRMEIGDR